GGRAGGWGGRGGGGGMERRGGAGGRGGYRRWGGGRGGRGRRGAVCTFGVIKTCLCPGVGDPPVYRPTHRTMLLRFRRRRPGCHARCASNSARAAGWLSRSVDVGSSCCCG